MKLEKKINFFPSLLLLAGTYLWVTLGILALLIPSFGARKLAILGPSLIFLNVGKFKFEH